MKLSHVLLSTLICFSLVTPHQTKAVNPLAIAQLATGALGAYATIELSTILYRYLKMAKLDVPIKLTISANRALILVLAGSLATGTCLVSGYQNL